MHFEGYTTDDFVMDAGFQQWVQHPTQASNAFWKKWIKAHPEQQPVIAEARTIVEAIQFAQKPMPEDKTLAIWNVLQKAVESEIAETTTSVFLQAVPVKKSLWVWLSMQKIAAGIASILMVAIAYFLLKDWTGMQKYTTAYGETRKIVLPDGSVVMLNANSSLSFAEDWQARSIREVWLNGEAFFSVVHTVNRQKFIVHTDDFLQVEVMGTEFNVAKRKNKTRIVLQSGQIKLNIGEAADNNQTENSLLMKPGELVEFDDIADRYIKKEVDPEVYSSWKSDKLLLDNTSLQEILQLLETNYGFESGVADSSLLAQQVSGSIPLGDTDVLLQYIAQTFEIKISRKKNLLTVRKLQSTK